MATVAPLLRQQEQDGSRSRRGAPRTTTRGRAVRRQDPEGDGVDAGPEQSIFTM
jgi:hypothetical protein